MLQKRGFWKLDFRIGGRKTPGHNPLVQNPLLGGSEPGGYVRGVYVRQSWNLAFKSAMCDSVGFIYIFIHHDYGSNPALPLNGNSDLGGYVRGVM